MSAIDNKHIFMVGYSKEAVGEMAKKPSAVGSQKDGKEAVSSRQSERWQRSRQQSAVGKDASVTKRVFILLIVFESEA